MVLRCVYTPTLYTLGTYAKAHVFIAATTISCVCMSAITCATRIDEILPANMLASLIKISYGLLDFGPKQTQCAVCPEDVAGCWGWLLAPH